MRVALKGGFFVGWSGLSCLFQLLMLEIFKSLGLSSEDEHDISQHADSFAGLILCVEDFSW